MRDSLRHPCCGTLMVHSLGRNHDDLMIVENCLNLRSRAPIAEKSIMHEDHDRSNFSILGHCDELEKAWAFKRGTTVTKIRNCDLVYPAL